MLRCNVDPDEAIIIYESLLLAQDGLVLETWLHLIYLVTPLDHKVYPDFSQLLTLYDKAQKKKLSALPSVMSAIGIDIATLYRWQARPPGSVDVDMCTNAVRLYGLHRETESNLAENKNASKMQNKPTALATRSSLSRKDWKTLSSCKRLWAAMLLEKALDGRPTELLCKEFGVGPEDVDALRFQVRIMASKVQKFCHEIGFVVPLDNYY